jgi:hypothetical protein
MKMIVPVILMSCVSVVFRSVGEADIMANGSRIAAMAMMRIRRFVASFDILKMPWNATVKYYKFNGRIFRKTKKLSSGKDHWTKKKASDLK